MSYKRNAVQTRINNENTKVKYRRKSVLKMVKELNEKGIKLTTSIDLRSNARINETYIKIKKQWSELRLKQRLKNKKKYKKVMNRINKERYKNDPDYKQKMLDRNIRKYEERKELLKKTTKIEKNLLRVIDALEYMQRDDYSSHINLVLSYLYDIRDDSVPEKLVTDKLVVKN